MSGASRRRYTFTKLFVLILCKVFIWTFVLLPIVNRPETSLHHGISIFDVTRSDVLNQLLMLPVQKIIRVTSFWWIELRQLEVFEYLLWASFGFVLPTISHPLLSWLYKINCKMTISSEKLSKLSFAIGSKGTADHNHVLAIYDLLSLTWLENYYGDDFPVTSAEAASWFILFYHCCQKASGSSQRAMISHPLQCYCIKFRAKWRSGC